MKKVFLIALFLLIQFSNVQAQDMQTAEQRENTLRQQLQQGADETAANQKRMEQQSQQTLLQDQQQAQFQAAHPFGIPTLAEAKKNNHDWKIYYVFEGSLLILSIGLLVFLLLIHIPNRLIDQNRWQHVGLVQAVRKGMTQANFNASNSKLLCGELLVVSVLFGIYFNSFLLFGAVFLGFIILICIRTTAFIIMYIFSIFWMLCAAQLGYLLCGGQFVSMGNYLAAWAGGLILAVIAFVCAAGLHMSGLQYLQDL